MARLRNRKATAGEHRVDLRGRNDAGAAVSTLLGARAGYATMLGLIGFCLIDSTES